MMKGDTCIRRAAGTAGILKRNDRGDPWDENAVQRFIEQRQIEQAMADLRLAGRNASETDDRQKKADDDISKTQKDKEDFLSQLLG